MMNSPHLPAEVVEEILDHLVDRYEQDPATQWSWGRHLSAHQKRRIELHFRNTWLPRLRITLHYGAWSHYEYKLADLHTTKGEDIVRFALDPLGTDGGPDRDLEKIWTQQEYAHAYLRVGEGYLRKRNLGSWIVNDTGLPNLEVETEGKAITFNWFKAMIALLQEEALLKTSREKLVRVSFCYHMLSKIGLIDQPEHLQLAQNQSSVSTLSTRKIIKHLVMDAQAAVRVSVLRHRHRRAGTDPVFHEDSQRYHKQTPTAVRPEHARGRCFCCSRTSAPDIFEIIAQEESVVPFVPGFESWQPEALIDALAEEHSWRCVQCQGRKDGDWRLERKRMFKPKTSDNWEKWVEETLQRWDMLG
jgi:hypothetical protein